MRARSCKDGSYPCGSPPTGMMVSTSASPSQATLATTSAQIPVVARIVGAAASAAGGSDEESPEQAAATRVAEASAATTLMLRVRDVVAEDRQGWP